MQIHGKLQSMSYFSNIDYQGYRTAGRHLPNAILKAETVHGIFVPALSEKGAKSLSELVMSENTWSTALAVDTTDLTGRRRKGSAWCKCNPSMVLYK